MSILKPSILANIPASQQRFLWCSQNSFQLNPLLFKHLSPRLLGLHNSYETRFPSTCVSFLSTCSTHPNMCYAPGSRRKKHWCDSSSCGRLSSAAAAVTPALYCGTNMMKGNKSRDVGLSS